MLYSILYYMFVKGYNICYIICCMHYIILQAILCIQSFPIQTLQEAESVLYHVPYPYMLYIAFYIYKLYWRLYNVLYYMLYYTLSNIPHDSAT